MTNGSDSGTIPFKRLQEIPGFFAFFTTRQGGTSAAPYDSLNLGLHTGDDREQVLANRRALLPMLKKAKPVCLKQVHGATVVVAGKGEASSGWEDYETGLIDCDGAVTQEKGLALCVSVADCLGIVLAHPKMRVFGVAHAGWRGALAKIGAKLVQSLKHEFGCDPSDLMAGLSPCLGPCCLELDEKAYHDFEKAFPQAWDYHTPLVQGHFKLDLWKLISLQLADEGIRLSNIEIQEKCTKDNPRLFYSHRRDQGKTGRMMLVAGVE